MARRGLVPGLPEYASKHIALFAKPTFAMDRMDLTNMIRTVTRVWGNDQAERQGEGPQMGVQGSLIHLEEAVEATVDRERKVGMEAVPSGESSR
jgi:hypothetical protein